MFNQIKNLIAPVLAIIIVLSSSLATFAYNNPELLPEEPTPVVDLARALSEKQRENLISTIDNYEKETGWKIRVLSQYDRTPGLALKNYWNLDERSLLIVADPRGGNLLNFNVGDAYFALMPRLFWVELQTRFGNQYYVKDHGEDGAILDAISSVRICLDKGGCNVVPGLPKEQWVWTLVTSILGGIVAGIAAFPRNKDQLIAWPWFLLLSPLWVMLFGVFGIAPVITRTTEILPLLRNFTGFISALIGSYLLAQATIGKELNNSSN